MSEEEQIFSSKVKYTGVFSFKDFYKFCFDYLKEEKSLDVGEGAYKEKIVGDTKEIEAKWDATKKVTDYFKFKIQVKFDIKRLANVEVMQDGIKVKTNQGEAEISVKGILIRDFEGKFEKDAFRKFLRGTYEKFIIAARIEEFEGKLIETCDGFLGQAKAYLDLEGKK